MKKVKIIHKPKEFPIYWQVTAMDGCYLAGFNSFTTALSYCAMQGFEVV